MDSIKEKKKKLRITLRQPEYLVCIDHLESTKVFILCHNLREFVNKFLSCCTRQYKLSKMYKVVKPMLEV